MDDAVPLLRARGARIVVDDVPSPAFDLLAAGPRLLLIGDVAPLLSVITGVPLGAGAAHGAALRQTFPPLEGFARVGAGSLEVAGHDLAHASGGSWLGIAPCDPPRPAASTVADWLDELAGLTLSGAGLPSGRAARGAAAERALVRVGLSYARTRSLHALGLPERRALSLAQADLGEPSVILAEAPLAGLEGAGATFVLGAFAAVTRGRRAIATVARPLAGTTEGVLARGATDFAIFSGGALVLAGHPRDLLVDRRVVRLTVLGDVDALREALAAEGVELTGGPERFAASLPEGKGPTDVLRAAARVRAGVVEVAPLM